MKKICVIIIVILIVFLGILSYYKFFYNKKEKQNNELFSTIEITDEKKEISKTKSYEEIYKENIITKIVTSYDYNLKIDSKIISGKIFIGNDKYLYITNNEDNINYRVLEQPITTMKIQNENDTNRLVIYLISKDGKLFIAQLINTDIKKITVTEKYTSYKIKNFTNIQFKSNSMFLNNALIVLADDGYMYDAFTDIKYDEAIVSLDSMYYVYSDNTMTNTYGNMLKDADGKYLKIKYYLQFIDGDRIFEDAFSIIITTDNRIVYVEENTNKLKIYNKKIKSIDYKLENESNVLNITFIFEDNTKMNTTAIHTSYYGFK